MFGDPNPSSVIIHSFPQMWPPLLLTLILTRYACAQGNDSIATITAVASTGFTAYTLGSFTYVWDGENGHDKSSTFLVRRHLMSSRPAQLNNITLELMSGKAEGSTHEAGRQRYADLVLC